jgi:AhpD family alkylhydroperoxidase
MTALPGRIKEETMTHCTGLLKTLAATLMIATFAMAPAKAEDASAQAAYKDIEATLGIVPRFFKAFPESGIAGAWAEFKSVQLNPATKLDGKTKELIGLAIAAQIPCEYCIYFHTVAAKANGASDEEVREAVAMSAIVRHWSTVLNGMQIDVKDFKGEVDHVMALATEKAKTAATSQ